jgi:pyruvate/2-oxoglutarate dehydrogenase complex dihydrolipoamide acyltransferase (E2) component
VRGADILVVPQLGEGLRTVVVSRHLKQPGEAVAVDEPLYEVETDKANIAIESSVSGVLREWLAPEGGVVPVGAPVAEIETDASRADARPRIPPRTIALCRRNNITPEDIARIPAAGSVLTEDDVLRFLDKQSRRVVASNLPPYEDIALSPRQQALNRSALHGAVDHPLPATIRRDVPCEDLQSALESARERDPDLHPTEFQVLVYCAARALIDNPKFRSTLINATTIRRYDHSHMGFAVALPDDELATAVVPLADTLGLPELVRSMRKQMRRARKGDFQVDAATTILVSSLRDYSVVDAIPILVPPAIAVLFIGANMGKAGSEMFSLSLTFDHRLVNGVGAARYLESICGVLQSLQTGSNAG